ncbi:MAG: hypothetical protein HRU09_17165 [Oligoflexales bacterium]|nr:hypothetical protein [Oligoflexales bacterium]
MATWTQKVCLGFAMTLAGQALSNDFNSGTSPQNFSLEKEAASTSWGVVCVRNQTNLTINFQTKWDGYNWESYSLAPGGYRWYSWRYEGGRSSPNFQVSFDYDLRDRRETYKYYSLERYQAQFEDCQYGKQYGFQQTGSFIDLYSLN